LDVVRFMLAVNARNKQKHMAQPFDFTGFLTATGFTTKWRIWGNELRPVGYPLHSAVSPYTSLDRFTAVYTTARRMLDDVDELNTPMPALMDLGLLATPNPLPRPSVSAVPNDLELPTHDTPDTPTSTRIGTDEEIIANCQTVYSSQLGACDTMTLSVNPVSPSVHSETYETSNEPMDMIPATSTPLSRLPKDL
jgi:hypothetical protein